MRKIKALLILGFLILTIICLNRRWGNIPPIGKLLNPFSGYIQNDKDLILSENQDFNEIFDSVKIHFDERSVPHIFATNENDLYFTQGYLHARDRLWQMDFLCRLAEGRLSEVFSSETIELDILNRRKSLLWSAQRSLEFIKTNHQKTYQQIKSYCDGINAFMHILDEKDYPVEFKILDYSPEEWSPLKTVLIQKYIADLLSGFDNDVERTNALNYFGKQDFDFLFKQQAKSQINCDTFFNKSKTKHKHHYDPNNNIIYGSKPNHGSNTWVISGRKSLTGYPILANDPHLDLTLPSIWYENQLCSSDQNCYGVSIPGIPFVIIGFNESVAWGITNGSTDVKQSFSINLRNSNNEYLINDQWLKSIKKPEIIEVYGSKCIIDTIVYTKIGPVTSDQKIFGKNLVIKWAGYEPSNDFNAFYLLNRAENYEDYSIASKYINCPNLNISFASKSDIAITHSGKIPVTDSICEQLVNESDNFINYKFISKELLPFEKNPERGFLFSSNQYPLGDIYHCNLKGNYDKYRNKTIDNLISSKSQWCTKDVMNLQLNNYDSFAAYALPIMLNKVDRNHLTGMSKQIIDSLINWKFDDASMLTAPLLFYNWWGIFYNETWDVIDRKNRIILSPSAEITLELLNESPNYKHFDIVSTKNIENGKDILSNSLDTLARMYQTYVEKNGETSWGKAKATSFTHLSRISAFSSEPVFCGGSPNCINAISSNHGPGWRMIVEFHEEGLLAWGAKPGGQSGNPGSSYYENGIKEWSDGKYFPLLFIQREEREKQNLEYLILK
jgi:penicillin amidase